jgi:hypothetical protein
MVCGIEQPAEEKRFNQMYGTEECSGNVKRMKHGLSEVKNVQLALQSPRDAESQRQSLLHVYHPSCSAIPHLPIDSGVLTEQGKMCVFGPRLACVNMQRG